MLDPIARVLGDILTFIYNTISFQNYGLAIIIFTVIVRLALLPLTLKQYKSSAKMQEIQPLIADIQKRYKDDKEKLNTEMMKVYQENGYNPASGCLPLLIQMPILITLYYVIVEPLKFMLDKDAATVKALVEVAAKGLNRTVQSMGIQKDLLTLNYFNEHKDQLAQVGGKLKSSELIEFNNFLGLHLGNTASYKPADLFGPQAHIYLPLFILAILAVVTTYISSKLAMPSANNQASNSQQNAMANSMTNSMLYIGPLMTLMFSFQLPAGVVLYWMVGYVVAIAQQMYINRYVLKKHLTPEQRALESAKAKEKAALAKGTVGQIGAGSTATESENNAPATAESAQTSGTAAKGGNTANSGNSGNKKPGSGQNKKGNSGSSYMGKKK